MPLFAGAGASALLAGYRPLAQIFDEIMTPTRELRAHYVPLIEAFDRMGPQEVERRFSFADRHLRDNGVVHRIYNARGGAERPLPLSHVPLIISKQDWANIEAGVVQRAELFNRLIADIYGAQNLIKSGEIPAALIAGSPRFLRPMVGATPAGGSHLLVYAVDLGRGPDGRWWALRDWTEAPAGAGYTVENRIALSRALPELYQPIGVKRLAHFFGALRDYLDGESDSGRKVGVLTAGSSNELAFEHAYLARYLGFVLVEGEDLVVRDDKVFVSTTRGLQPIDVLLRRLDSDFADPLLFNANSWIGTPGLALAARGGRVMIANALGAGVAEATGLLGFLPRLAQNILGEDLRLPGVATWWCGQSEARASMLSDLQKLVIAPAFGATVPGVLDEGAVHMRDLQQAQRDKIAAAIVERGIDFVAQEAVQLSTMPVWANGRLEPRPFVLRIYAARTEEGWQVLPGGFCQVSASLDPRAVSLQRGSSLADVWVLSDQADEGASLLPGEASAEVHRTRDVLPTRVAENLFWLGRYLERAENCVRLARALALRLIGFDAENDGVIPFLVRLMTEFGALDPRIASTRSAAEAAVEWALSERAPPNAFLATLSYARNCASKARDQISADAWKVLSELVDLAEHWRIAGITMQDALERCNEILRDVAAFAGLSDNNMNRLSGWHFLQLGTCVERAINTAWLTRSLADVKAPPGSFEALLELADSQINFGTLYSSVPLRSQVVDLVVLDAHNPRSLVYQATRIDGLMKRLGELAGDFGPTASRKLSILIGAEVNVLDPDEVTGEKLAHVIASLRALSDAVTSDFFVHWRSSAGADL